VSVVNETRGRIEGVIPEVASELDAVHSLLDDTVKETGMIRQRDSEMVLQDEEARKIFKESSFFAEEQIRKQFPELPSATCEHDTAQQSEKSLVADTMPLHTVSTTKEEAALEAEGLTEGLDPEGQELPSIVYEYIRSHVRPGGKLNLTECAKALGVQRDDVMRAVEALRKERRVVLQ